MSLFMRAVNMPTLKNKSAEHSGAQRQEVNPTQQNELRLIIYIKKTPSMSVSEYNFLMATNQINQTISNLRSRGWTVTVLPLATVFTPQFSAQ